MKIAELLLTIDQAASRGKVPPDTLRCWIRTGRLPVMRQGGRVLITRGALEGLLYPVCELCGQRFRRGNLRARYCGQSCRQKAHRLKGGITA